MDINITNKHLGNILSRMSDRDIKEVFEQFTEELGINIEDTLDYLTMVLITNEFEDNGDMYFEWDDWLEG